MVSVKELTEQHTILQATSARLRSANPEERVQLLLAQSEARKRLDALNAEVAAERLPEEIVPAPEVTLAQIQAEAESRIRADVERRRPGFLDQPGELE